MALKERGQLHHRLKTTAPAFLLAVAQPHDQMLASGGSLNNCPQ